MDFKIEPLQNPNITSPIGGPAQMAFFNPRKIKIIFGGLAALLAISIIFFFLGRGSFKENGVELKIEAPSEATGGELLTYKIKYKNNNAVSLSDVKLNILYPPDSVVIKNGNLAGSTTENFEIGNVRSKEAGEKELTAYIVGDKGNIKTLRASLTYKAGKLSPTFRKEASLATTITLLAVPVTLVAAPTVTSGQNTSYFIDYRNQSNQDIENLRFVVKYPQGFTPIKSSPEASARSSGQSTWDITKLKQDDGSRIAIQGILSGNERETKTVFVTLQKRITTPSGDAYVDFEKSEASSVISTPILSLDLRLNDSDDYVAHLADTLRYKLRFRNNNSEGISGLNLSVKLEGGMYDFTTVKSDGFFDSRLNTIVWNASTVPALNLLPPNQSGTVEFEVRLKSVFSGSSGAMNSFVKANAHIETTNVPANLELDKLSVDNELVTRISTAPTFDQKIFVNDPTFGSSGLFPPKVDQKTVLTARWILVNPSNDISQAKITATLAPGIVWENGIRVNGTQIKPSYDSRLNTVTWDLGTLPTSTGVNFPIYETFFQISITPSVNQVGQQALLLKNVRFDGVDSFTKEKISRAVTDVSTGNVSDNNTGGVVQP